MIRRFLGIAALFAIVMLAPQLASAATYYIDWVGGSNANNGTSQATAWKSAPGMQQVSGCAGATHSYTHAAGDQIIFKGGSGETWPAACFQWTISSGGTPSAQDYIGACLSNTDFAAQYPLVPLSFNFSPCANGTSWPSTGWTRPKFDLAQSIPTGNHVIVVGSSYPGYTTFDELEIANQGLSLTSAFDNDDAYNFAAKTGSMPGVLIENGYVHDWVSNTNVAAITGSGVWPNSAGFVFDNGRVTVDHMTVSDVNGFVFAGATKITGGFSGGCRNCATLSNSVMHDQSIGAFTVTTIHDNEFYNFSQKIFNYCGDASGNGGGACRPHSQIIEDDNTADAGGETAYNNKLHDSPTVGVCIYLPYRSRAFNNVVWNCPQNVAGTYASGDSASAQGFWYQNTFDCSSGGFCIKGDPPSKGNGLGTLFFKNNILIPGTAGIATCFNTSQCANIATITTVGATGKNLTMPASEASKYGFVASGSYKPSSSDPNVSGQGLNLSSQCSGSLAQLCFDASGAPWFGGSYIARPPSPDLGAFQGQGSGGNLPPTVSFTSPTCGTSCTGTQTLTVTATPQGSATISGCQFSIDGFAFGSAITSSPYTTTWNTNTASNTRAHTLSVVCTDSNNQTGSASVSATPTNSHSGGFVSDKCGFSGDACKQAPPSLTFTAQTTGSVTYPVCIKPFSTTNNNNEVGVSSGAPASFNDFASIISIQPPGYITVYNPTTGTYTTDMGATAYPATANTKYCFAWTVNMTALASTVAETSPSVVNNIATNFPFRDTTDGSVAVLSAYAATNSTPDTVEVSGFSVPSTPTLSITPGNLSFGNVNNTTTAMLTESVTVANGPATISSVTPSTNFTVDAASTCPSSGSLSSSCTWIIDATPPSTGTFNGTLTITGNQAGSPQVFSLSVTGVPATSSATPSPASINFGNVQIGPTCPPSCATSGPATMTLANGPVTFASPAVTFDNPDFSVASITCSGSVSASSCQITPQFIPSVLGNETATMTVHDNAPTSGSTQTVSLLGTGVNFPTPAPATNFVFDPTFPIMITLGKKTFTENYQATCTCNLVNLQWGCVCQ